MSGNITIDAETITIGIQGTLVYLALYVATTFYGLYVKTKLMKAVGIKKFDRQGIFLPWAILPYSTQEC